jgi:hypothetical protein
MSFTVGSLFDGSGGFPLAAFECGGIPVWASEIEPYPIAVTKSRFPYMKHLGSVTDINGGEVEPVDVITFGSPCQDLSVAGKRAGLKHEENGYSETLTLDRENNDLGYSPDNCRWVTRKVQANNRGSNRVLTLNGESHNIQWWVEKTGLSRSLIDGRLKRGWDDVKTLTTPLLTKGGKIRES